MFKTLNDFDFNGKTVFIRADLNVPAKDGQITDTTRIDRFVPTLKEIVAILYPLSFLYYFV